jgi:PAS domain S-box-containing protein
MQQDNDTREQRLAELVNLRHQVAVLEASNQKLEETLKLREHEINALLSINPQPVIARFDRQLRQTYIHTSIALQTGIAPDAYLGKTSREMGMPEPVITLLENALNSVFTSGLEKTIEYSVSAVNRKWVYESRLIPEFAPLHQVESVLSITRDISHQKRAEEALLENFQILETVNRVGKVLSAELDLQKLVQVVTDTATELSRAEIGAFFYNVLDERGESYTLYTISGVPQDTFSNYPMPRNTDVFGPTFRGEGTIRIDDVRKDPRYGKNSPYHGMPKGHFPVVSYLAVPVISQTHEVLGGLFLGHSEAGIFTERDERVVEGLAAQGAIAMDNARLYQETQQQQQRLQVTLASIGDAVITTDTEGHITYMNAVAEELTACTNRDAIGKPLGEVFRVVSSRTRIAMESPVKRVIQEGKSIGLSNGALLLAYDGRERHIDHNGAPIFVASQGLVGVILVFRDITARWENEQRINLLLELSASFSKALTPNQIAEVVVKQALKSLGAHVGTVSLLVDHDSTLEILNLHGLSQDSIEKYRRTSLDLAGPLNDAVRTGNLVWIETTEQYFTRYPHFAEAVKRNGSHSTISIPLTIDERIIGGFNLSFPFEKQRNASEEAFFMALAQLCAQALERARLYESASDMRETLQLRVRLQSVISELGQQALTSYDLPALMNKTAEVLAQTLEVEYTKILELLSDENKLLLRAGVGWKEGYVGQAKVEADLNSQAGYTLQSHTPVIVRNLPTETRFHGPQLLLEHGVISGMSVIIEGYKGPWGVLGIHSGQPRSFTSDDIYFVQSVANILGAALERTRLDALVETQRQWLANVIATVPGVIWENHHTDDREEMKLVFISAYIETMLGYTVEEALTEPHFWFRIFHPEDAQKTAKAFNRIWQSGGSGVINFRAVHKSGRILDIQALMTTILKDGKPVGKRGVMMDVSERQSLMNAQINYATMLRRSHEELQQFAYIASHDLQEPLRMVTSYLQILESRYSDKLDSDAHEFIAYAVDGAARMKALITDLLAYSRVDGGEKVFEVFDAQMALNQALTNLALNIEDTNARVTYDKLPSIKGDPAKITQVFQNLIGNAIKFQSGDAPRIHIGVERKKSEWQFTVRDNGIGIEPQYLERIFVIFQRLHRKDQYPGTGIGLSICKKVVEWHGGRIWVESTPGQGTTFYFTIPL